MGFNLETEKEKTARHENDIRDFQQSVDQGGKTLQNGRIARDVTGPHQDPHLIARKKEQEETKRFMVKQSAQILENHLSEINRQLEEVNRVLAVFDDLEALIRSGKFDKTNNDHMAMLQITGMTLEEVESADALRIHQEKKNPHLERKEELVEKAKPLVEQLERDNPNSEELQKFKQNVGEAGGEVAYEIAANMEVTDAATVIAKEVNTEDFSKNSISGGLSSFASAFGDGIQATPPSIRPEFAKASDPKQTPETKVALEKTSTPDLPNPSA